MSELDFVKRVKALHVNEANGYGPGDCHCDECVETMDILSTLDGLPDTHLLKLGESGWAIEHPVACRLELAVRGLTLHDCELHEQAHTILQDNKPGHLALNTYEIEYRDGELQVHGKGDSTWYPLRRPVDPVSESYRSPGT